MTYDYIITKPTLEEALMHYGVKGMKWGKHSKLVSSGAEAYKIISGWSDKEYQDRLSRVKLTGGRSSGSSKKSGSGKSGSSSAKEKKTSGSSSSKKTTDVKEKSKEVVNDIIKTTIDPNYTKKLQSRLDAINNSSKLKKYEESGKKIDEKNKRLKKRITG